MRYIYIYIMERIESSGERGRERLEMRSEGDRRERGREGGEGERGREGYTG
jgi:hypothetical protein